MKRSLTHSPLLAPCDNCGKLGALLDAQSGEHYCKDCTRTNALYAASLEQLQALLTETMVAWGLTWSGEFSLAMLSEIAEVAASEAHGDFEQQVRVDYPDDQEGVRAAHLHQAAD